MTLLIGTKREQIELREVRWVIMDQKQFNICTDGDVVVIEEVRDDDKDL